ncbi:MAG: molecular chaperone GrpE [Solirubrobacteraceae bacterium]|jgi:molecular chaperone GrpE|nr:molecular chaperone GrpE [Solirubrobacteraceae bacterium]
MPSSPGSSRSEQQSPPADAGTPDESGRPPASEEAPNGRAADTGREDELRSEVARLDDRYKRALADLDNYRKRSARDIDRRVQEARDALLREWLEALDSVERALRIDAGTPLAEGMRAVLEQMESILARYGVHRIGEAGERFDPERHEAVGVRMTDEVPDHTVVEVARSGFAAGDRVLRPAQVIVSRRPAPEG